MKTKGLYIVFEGPEGCGKSTQLPRIADLLSNKEYGLFVTKEPGGTDFGKEIREILLYKGAEDITKKLGNLLNKYNDKLSPMTQKFIGKAMNEPVVNNDLTAAAESYLFNADRNHLMKTIQQKKAEGKIILSDRNYFSTLAYQGYAGKKDIKTLEEQINLATEGFKPNLVVVFMIDPEIGLERAKKATGARKDRMEHKPLSYHQALSEGYRQIIPSEKRKGISVVKIDVTVKATNTIYEKSIERVFSETSKLILSYIETKKSS